MSEHTPGDWYVGHDSINPLTGDASLSVGPVGYTVAAVVREEDARLIAAAPELLAVLKQILQYGEQIDGTGIRYTFDYMSPLGKSARAAIAKATGEGTAK